ncbi:MAG TPA: A24 family peptidase [Terriglobia bacterium]|nr:A24 family peptidase [Terriglobia bacterium]
MLGALISAAAGAVSDVRSKRIPNWLNYGSLILGLAFQGVFGGWRGLAQGALGALVAGGVFFLFFLVRGMGAGDVKLMAAIGAWVGLQHAVLAMVFTAFAGAALAVLYMVFHRRVSSTLQNMGELLHFHLTSGIRPHPEVNLQDPVAIRVPYGLAIAAGTLFLFLSNATF